MPSTSWSSDNTEMGGAPVAAAEDVLRVWGVNLDHISLAEEYGKNRLRATALLRRIREDEWARPFGAGLTRCCRRLRDGRYETLGAIVRDVRAMWAKAYVEYSDDFDVAIMARLLSTKFSEAVALAIKLGDFVASSTHSLSPADAHADPKERKKPGPKPRKTKPQQQRHHALPKGLKRRGEVKCGSYSAKLARLCQDSWLSALECCQHLGEAPTSEACARARKTISKVGLLMCDLDPNEDARVAARRLFAADLGEAAEESLPPPPIHCAAPQQQLNCDIAVSHDETMAHARNLWLPIVDRLVRALVVDFRHSAEAARKKLAANEFWKLTAAVEREESGLGQLSTEPQLLDRRLTDRDLALTLCKITERHARLAQVLLFKHIVDLDSPELNQLADCCASNSQVHNSLQLAAQVMRSVDKDNDDDDDDAAANAHRRRLRELRLVRCALLLARRHLLVVYLDSRLDTRLPASCVMARSQVLLSILKPWNNTTLPNFFSSNDHADDDTARERRRLLADFQPFTMADAGLDFIQLRLRHKVHLKATATRTSSHDDEPDEADLSPPHTPLAHTSPTRSPQPHTSS